MGMVGSVDMQLGALEIEQFLQKFSYESWICWITKRGGESVIEQHNPF
jgi:hypothetical protein